MRGVFCLPSAAVTREHRDEIAHQKQLRELSGDEVGSGQARNTSALQFS